jgi:hypothetical protein
MLLRRKRKGIHLGVLWQNAADGGWGHGLQEHQAVVAVAANMKSAGKAKEEKTGDAVGGSTKWYDFKAARNGRV